MRAAATSLALIVVVAMATRIAFAWNQSLKIPQGVLAVVPFQQETGNIAYSLAQGRGFGNVFRIETGPTAWLAPVYPFLLAAIFKLFGIFAARAFFAAVALNIVCSSAACIPIFFAAKRIAGPAVAGGAAWLWAFFPNAVMMPFEWIWDTSLSALLAATILWATLALAASDRSRDWCAYGLLWGFALMTNPSLGALMPFLFAWLVYRRHVEGRFRWRLVATAAFLAILCCLPWTIRNYTAFHQFIPLRSNFPFELWLGNNDIFDEHAVNGRTSITRMEEVRTYTQLGETVYMQQKWRIATQFIASRPALELRLTARKFSSFWTGSDAPLGKFRETHSALIRLILLSNFIIAIGALFGILSLLHKHSPMTFALAVFPLVFPCLYYLTHADLRYRHPIDPILCLLTAIAVASAFNLAAKPQLRS